MRYHRIGKARTLPSKTFFNSLKAGQHTFFIPPTDSLKFWILLNQEHWPVLVDSAPNSAYVEPVNWVSIDAHTFRCRSK